MIFFYWVINTVTGWIDVLLHKSTLAKRRLKNTLGETRISLGKAYNYCR